MYPVGVPLIITDKVMPMLRRDETSVSPRMMSEHGTSGRASQPPQFLSCRGLRGRGGGGRGAPAAAVHIVQTANDGGERERQQGEANGDTGDEPSAGHHRPECSRHIAKEKCRDVVDERNGEHL